ncbi:MAG: hypothetical protein L3K05_06210, partial [Thermoplasmata archaeon]|nr:hypothetical protein [Thermoplasmata archaeon]
MQVPPDRRWPAPSVNSTSIRGAIIVALIGALVVLTSVAGASIPLGARTSNSPAEPAIQAATTISGALVPLGILGETGAALGGTPNPSVAVPVDTIVSVDVDLPLQHPGELNAFLQSVSNPDSPQYADFLTDAQFATEYAPPAADQSLVATYLESNGLRVIDLAPNHLSLVAQGPLSDVARAFHVTYAMYSAGGHSFWAPVDGPSVPASLAPLIFGVAGLTNDPSNVHLAVVGPSTSSAVPGVGVLDRPDEMHFEFQLNQLYNATGDRAVGVVPTYARGVTIVPALWSVSSTSCGYSTSDLANFFNNSTGYPGGLPGIAIQPHYSIPGYAGGAPASGNCSTAGLNVSNVGTQEVSSPTIELSLDQEYSGVDAPGATIAPTWVNGTGPAATNGELVGLLNWATGGNLPGMDVLTQSFGGGESPDSHGSFEAILEQDYLAAEATGVTVLASSGDSNGAEGPQADGAALCGPGPTDEGVPGIDFPGSSPAVLSVGGTANMAHGTSMLGGQTVWNWCPNADGGVSAGSSGGVSLAFPEAWYQHGIPAVDSAMRNAIRVTTTGNGSTSSPGGINNGTVYNATSARPDPDIGGPSANNSVFFAGQWLTGYGGTSFSSPAVAGMLGSVIAFDGHKLGAVGPALYALEKKWLAGQLPYPPTYFVQNYSNAFFNGSPDFNTSAGWGVPLAYNIARDLGKPFLTTGAHAPPAAGKPYNVTVRASDVRPVASVNVTYKEP